MSEILEQRKGLVALNRQKTQEQRPEWTTVTLTSMLVIQGTSIYFNLFGGMYLVLRTCCVQFKSLLFGPLSVNYFPLLMLYIH